MQLQWTRNKAWAMALLLVAGAVGCSKVDRPRLGEGGKVGGEPGVPLTKAKSSRDLSEISPEKMSTAVQEFCQKLEQQNGIALKRSLKEYSPLRELIRTMSPAAQEDPGVLLRAHARAL